MICRVTSYIIDNSTGSESPRIHECTIEGTKTECYDYMIELAEKFIEQYRGFQIIEKKKNSVILSTSNATKKVFMLSK